MEQFERITGIALPLLRDNIDTDQIIPVPEMTRSNDETHERWGAGLFAYWRYTGDRVSNPDFILNQTPYHQAVILLAGKNFGCGSSREAAPKALRGYGFRVLIASSFAGILYANSFRNGLLPVQLPSEQIEELARQMQAAHGTATITVDLHTETVIAPDAQVFHFSTPAPLRDMLLNGRDEIDQTLLKREAIEAYWKADALKRPWVYDLPA